MTWNISFQPKFNANPQGKVEKMYLHKLWTVLLTALVECQVFHSCVFTFSNLYNSVLISDMIIFLLRKEKKNTKCLKFSQCLHAVYT